MIQSYLKTGMVVYDDREKQHFRSGCCEDIFCQFTDDTHFPGFQFVVSQPLTEPVVATMTIYDINDVGIGNAPGFPAFTVYHSGDDYILSHNSMDAVVWPAEVDYETCYYFLISLPIPGEEAGDVVFYSEVFRICDCEPDGAGDGLNLIENGWMEDWAGLANPNNYPLGWTLQNNDATNYVSTVAGGYRCRMISNNGSHVYIYQTILTIGKWYVWNLAITNSNSGSIEIGNGVILLDTINGVGTHTGVFQATATTFLIAEGAPPNVDITFTDVRVEEFVGFEFCDRMTLNWWSDCDWDDIIYHDGYRNSLVLADPENIGLQLPSEDIVVNPDERLGELFARDVIIKKRYRFKIRIPEYLWNALIRLPAYGSEMPNFHCWITLPDGSATPMSEVIVSGEWDTGNCFNTFEVEFVDNDEYPVVAGNCCKNEDVSEV